MEYSTRGIKVLLFLICTTSTAQIRIILTAALSSNHEAFRKKQYLESFRCLQRLGFTKNDLYVVEALKKTGPTFLDEYSSHVYYAQNNDASFKNNGANEALTLLEALDYFQFDDDDIIIKLTGRHQLTSRYFLQLITSKPNYDAYFKFHPNVKDYAYTVTFAMRCKCYKEMLQSIDLYTIGNTICAIEEPIANYLYTQVKAGKLKLYTVDKLHVTANVFGSTTCPAMAGTFYF